MEENPYLGGTEEHIAGTGREKIMVWKIGRAMLTLDTDGNVLPLMDNSARALIMLSWPFHGVHAPKTLMRQIAY